MRRPGWGRGLARSWGSGGAGAVCGIGEGLGGAVRVGEVWEKRWGWGRARGEAVGLVGVAARAVGLGVSS